MHRERVGERCRNRVCEVAALKISAEPCVGAKLERNSMARGTMLAKCDGVTVRMNILRKCRFRYLIDQFLRACARCNQRG